MSRSTDRRPPRAQPLLGVAEQLRAIVSATVGEASGQLQQARGESASWRQRYQDLLIKHTGLQGELARRDLLQAAGQELEVRARELQQERGRRELDRGRLAEQLEAAQHRCQELAGQLALEERRRRQAEAALADAVEELEEIRALVDLLELETQSRT